MVHSHVGYQSLSNILYNERFGSVPDCPTTNRTTRFSKIKIQQNSEKFGSLRFLNFFYQFLVFLYRFDFKHPSMCEGAGILWWRRGACCTFQLLSIGVLLMCGEVHGKDSGVRLPSLDSILSGGPLQCSDAHGCYDADAELVSVSLFFFLFFFCFSFFSIFFLFFFLFSFSCNFLKIIKSQTKLEAYNMFLCETEVILLYEIGNVYLCDLC